MKAQYLKVRYSLVVDADMKKDRPTFSWMQPGSRSFSLTPGGWYKVYSVPDDQTHLPR